MLYHKSSQREPIEVQLYNLHTGFIWLYHHAHQDIIRIRLSRGANEGSAEGSWKYYNSHIFYWPHSWIFSSLYQWENWWASDQLKTYSITLYHVFLLGWLTWLSTLRLIYKFGEPVIFIVVKNYKTV